MVKILLAGGGTLGSVSPLIAIAQSYSEADYLFIGTHNGPERNFIQKKGVRYRVIWSAKWRRYWSLLNVVDIFKFPVSLIQALIILASYKPDIILTSGSFVAVPVVVAGKLMGIPIFVHQQDIQLGLANKIMQYFATIITVSFDEQRKLFPTKEAIVTGNPVRSMTVDRPTVQKNMVLILGGSSGARPLNKAMHKIIPRLIEHSEVVHVLGNNNYDQRLDLERNYTPVKFLDDDAGQLFAEARIVISRAGAATMPELAAFKKSVLLVPMSGTHQEANADFFARHNAAIVVSEKKPEQMLESAVRLLQNESERKAISNNLSALFPRDTNQRYVDLIKKYVNHRTEGRVAYFVGIGGSGISALAQYFLHDGFKIVGSDLSHTEVTKRLIEKGASIFFDHDKNNIPSDTAIVIYSDAVPQTNPELLYTRSRHIAVYSYNEYLGLLSKKYNTIAVSGTHGKTTTTAMLGLTLMDAHKDPTVIVGAFIPQLNDSNYRFGASDNFVVEADEYRAHMLMLSPKTIIVNNIDADHLDFYQNIDEIKKKFQQFVDVLPEGGTLIVNNDDEFASKLSFPNTITYGLTKPADFYALNIRLQPGKQIFSVYQRDQSLGDFSLRIPGHFNIFNALACIAAAVNQGIAVESIKKTLSEYAGAWRRFEKVGQFRGCPVYSDYAHHPTEIMASLAGIREFYPDKKIFLVFQPHSYDRTKKLGADFSRSFTDAETVVLTEVYDVVGRDVDRTFSSENIFKHMPQDRRFFVKTIPDAKKIIIDTIKPDHVLVIMGAGDIDSLAREIVQTK